MRRITSRFRVKSYYVKGRFFRPKVKACEVEAFDPAAPKDRVWSTWGDRDLVDRAVDAARGAFENHTSPFSRDWRPFFAKLKAQLLNRRRELAKSISIATGRPMWETSLEVKASVALARKARNMPPPDLMARAGDMVNVPSGVVALFPARDLPLLQPLEVLIEAVVSGNSVVMLPHAGCGPVALIVAEMLHECDLDQGVFNLVHGDSDMEDYLATHPGVNHVVKPECSGPVTGGGAENDGLVLAEDDLDYAALNAAVGAFLSAGQRRDSLKRVFAEQEIAARFAQRLAEVGEGIVSGHPVKDGHRCFMGPLADGEAHRAFSEYLESGPGTPVAEEDAGDIGSGFYVKPSVRLLGTGEARPSRISSGPVVLVTEVQGMEEVLSLARLDPAKRTFTFLGRGSARISVVRSLRARFVGMGVSPPGEWLRRAEQESVTLAWERPWVSAFARPVEMAEELRDEPFKGLPGLARSRR